MVTAELAVTILTSDGDAPPHILPKRVMAAVESGCGGIVCAAGETCCAFATGFVRTTVGGVASRVITVDAGVSSERSDTTPPTQFAATVYTYVCCGVSPVSVYVVAVPSDSPTFTPFRYTL